MFGRNKSTKLLDFIAQQSGYKDADRCTAHGRRALGISMVANANVGPGVLTGLGGHSSLNMVARYHKPDQVALDTAVRAKNASPSKIKAYLAHSGTAILKPPPQPNCPPTPTIVATKSPSYSNTTSPLGFPPANNYYSPTPSSAEELSIVDLQQENHSSDNDSDNAAGNLGAMTQWIIDKKEEDSPPSPSCPAGSNFPSAISVAASDFTSTSTSSKKRRAEQLLSYQQDEERPFLYVFIYCCYVFCRYRKIKGIS